MVTLTNKRRPIVAGNWKMHGSRAANHVLLEGLLQGGESDGVGCLVFPPFVYLADAVRQLAGTSIGVGAQDVCAEAQGAFTGEVSAAMLADVGATHVLAGHSERRAL